MGILPALPSALMLGAIGLGWGLACGHLAGWLNQRRGVRTGFTRKIFHFLIFAGAAGVHLLGGGERHGRTALARVNSVVGCVQIACR